MPKIPQSTADLNLARIATADYETICSQEPQTFFEACWPSMWVAETIYPLGSVIHPPTDNNMVYECIAVGTSGATEPPWGDESSETFADGTVTWKTHNNYSLVSVGLDTADKTIGNFVENETVVGRQLSIAAKQNTVSHRAGTVTHRALLNSTDKTVEYSTESATTVAEDNDILSGRTIILQGISIRIRVEIAA